MQIASGNEKAKEVGVRAGMILSPRNHGCILVKTVHFCSRIDFSIYKELNLLERIRTQESLFWEFDPALVQGQRYFAKNAPD